MNNETSLEELYMAFNCINVLISHFRDDLAIAGEWRKYEINEKITELAVKKSKILKLIENKINNITFNE